MTRPAGILFTAFERSGDELAAPVIARWRELNPDAPVWALGGPRMEQAGARLLETTTQHAAMLLGALGQVRAHLQRLRRLRSFLEQNRLQALVPVDSPAANWSVCRAVRRLRPAARIVHLAAPQLWAWASWRVGRLRRLSDHVLCLLPFEPDWFGARGVPATFVGHPLFDGSAGPAPALPAADLPPALLAGRPRLLLMPGSRLGEVKANWPTMARAAQTLKARQPSLAVAVAAIDPRAAQLIHALNRRDRLPDGADAPALLVNRADALLDWADVVLAKSGTATLHVAARGKPLVALYNVPRWEWELLGRWLVRTPTFTLPNLLGEFAGLGRIVPEFVPHFGRVPPVVDALQPLLQDPAARQRQVEALRRVAALFADRPFADVAARRITELVRAGAPV